MTPTRQTQSFLRRRFAEVGLEPVKKHGQNFLIDLNLMELLAKSADLQPTDVVLEVGTGTGALTGIMAQQAAHVISVEIDPRLHQLASEELIDQPNVTLLCQDALQDKNHLAPNILELVQSELTAGPDRQFKVAANLPYCVATPIISNLLLDPPLPVSLTVTIQLELAQRITAVPQTKDYSALSIWVQCQANAEILRVLPPSAFWPRPQVESAILKITPDPALRRQIPDLRGFHEFIRALFLYRRKHLRGVLIHALKKQLPKSDVDTLLAGLSFAENARVEELSVPELLMLHGAVTVFLRR
ncbi:MAG: 16S rRNA (adenine(1518)-N(6)/adenine(1519)-N(6))-dimethyltransferase RsmA [Pirellulales bacterium]|nr:16S rRNA (adenine(1518)-N(6)/adenine(1519)-N(6))-dimethyltransferase RsmA [Pirellulales bacterium]